MVSRLFSDLNSCVFLGCGKGASDPKKLRAIVVFHLSAKKNVTFRLSG
ncbi:hypothetical protein QUB16_15390 [Microcoleus sp. D3_18a_C4]